MCGAEKVRHMLMGEQVLKKWKKSKKMTVAFGGILVMSVVTVSYTHLDVYKRQVAEIIICTVILGILWHNMNAKYGD